MNDRDKVQALWLNLNMILNELEGLGEDVRTRENSPCVYGTSGCTVWNPDTQSWDLEAP